MSDRSKKVPSVNFLSTESQNGARIDSAGRPSMSACHSASAKLRSRVPGRRSGEAFLKTAGKSRQFAVRIVARAIDEIVCKQIWHNPPSVAGLDNQLGCPQPLNRVLEQSRGTFRQLGGLLESDLPVAPGREDSDDAKYLFYDRLVHSVGECGKAFVFEASEDFWARMHSELTNAWGGSSSRATSPAPTVTISALPRAMSTTCSITAWRACGARRVAISIN